jgi:hypothetical protein
MPPPLKPESSNLDGFEEELTQLYCQRGLLPFSREACCSKHSFATPQFCSAYVGSFYGRGSGPRVLFVGYDCGRDPDPTPVDRRNTILTAYREKATEWNQHYKGLICVAGALTGSHCSELCGQKCALAPEEDCVLCRVAQTNAVKCVPENSSSMDFQGRKYIKACIPLLFSEIEILRPDVIVVHGADLWHPFELQSKRLGNFEFGPDHRIGVLRLQRNAGETTNCTVGFLRHPARGWLKTDLREGMVSRLASAVPPTDGD